ncbi:MAG: hypothetical protein SNJ74_01375 [Fimbriimonadaceae bacterium]
MTKDFYRKLVDLYAARELPQELEDEMEAAAFQDPDLSHDMATLRKTVDLLRETPQPEFTEETYQRILMRIYAKGVDIRPPGPTPSHLQLHLPMQG